MNDEVVWGGCLTCEELVGGVLTQLSVTDLVWSISVAESFTRARSNNSK